MLRLDGGKERKLLPIRTYIDPSGIVAPLSDLALSNCLVVTLAPSKVSIFKIGTIQIGINEVCFKENSSC